MDALCMQGVGLDYPGRPDVLKDISFAVQAGELLVIEGRSGSGKSSLLTIAAGIQPPSRGEVTVMDAPVPTAPDAAARMRADHIGLVFQHLHLMPELNVSENIDLPLRLRNEAPYDRRTRTEELLDLFDITPLADKMPHTLSGGEQQRAAIARALAADPALLLADEPTSALDEENARNVRAALEQAARTGTAVVVATHDPVFLDAQRVMRIADGRVPS